MTQQQLSEIADLSVTGLAMIERGAASAESRLRHAFICWALDVASGMRGTAARSRLDNGAQKGDVGASATPSRCRWPGAPRRFLDN